MVTRATRATRTNETLLPPRQRETLRLLAAGLTQDEVAASRGVSRQTIKNQVALLCRRLGARNAAHAVARGYETGNLPAAPLPDPRAQQEAQTEAMVRAIQAGRSLAEVGREHGLTRAAVHHRVQRRGLRVRDLRT